MFLKLLNRLGIKDFLPTHTQDTHENFTFVMDKAARWAAEQTDISLSYMQAVFIKKKGNIFLRFQAYDSENIYFFLVCYLWDAVYIPPNCELHRNPLIFKSNCFYK